MLFNKRKRIEYLGFDDKWFVIIGIFVLGFVTDYLFTNSFGRFPLQEALINWSISVFFTICNWTFMRSVIIALRIKYPTLRETAKRILIALVILVISVIFIDYAGNVLLAKMWGTSYHPKERSFVLLPIVLISTMVQATYEAIYHFTKLKTAIRLEAEAKQNMIQAQLNALKNQSQPHFFFNSMNTLKDIIDQNSKEEAKDFVDKLSVVYRFILEAGNKNLIPLEEEMKFAEAYIHIQKERFGDNLLVNWEIDEDYKSKFIVPLSLQLLLENAIKHNIISKNKPLTVSIATDGDGEIVTVTNKIQLKSTRLPSTKMGLKNIESRYKLISNKMPEIINDGIDFWVKLPLLQSVKPTMG